jgi:type IV secretory pathway VirB10-like protein
MSGQSGWKAKAKRIAAGVQVPFAIFGAAQGPPPQQSTAPPPSRPGIVRPAETQPPPRVPVQYKLWGQNEIRRTKEQQRTAMADAAARQQTTSQQIDPVKAADHREKRKQRAAETSAGAVPATAKRADPGRERKRSERSR